MKFLILVIDTASNTGTSQELVEIDKFNSNLEKNGHFIMAAGIGSSQTATLIDNRSGANIATPSSLNGNEFYSGFWIIQAKDAAEAKELALEGSRACNRKVELRPFLGQS
ncbi:MAG: hypothetical protein RLZZ122_999 [Actinomycetota bacterium]